MRRALMFGTLIGAAVGLSLAPRRGRGARARGATGWSRRQQEHDEKHMPDAEHAAVPAPSPETKTTSQPEVADAAVAQSSLDVSQGPPPDLRVPGAR